MVIINQELRYEASNYNDSELLVECSDPQILVDGLELVSGHKYTPQNPLVILKEDFAEYIALEVSQYIN